MNQETPARVIHHKDLAANLEGFKELATRIPPKLVKSILDIRYGLGDWARVARELFPGAWICGYEADEMTARQAWRGEGVDLYADHYVPKGGTPVSLLLADFNYLTCLNRIKHLDPVVEARKPLFVIVTDVACAKLHINYDAYGLPKASLGAYWANYDLPGYSLSGYVRKHAGASQGLFQREVPL